MKRESYDIYLDDIIRNNPLSQAEEYNLSLRIKQGDREALDLLVTSNLKFVIYIAKQYQGQGIEFEDLVSEGNLALIQAASKFDATTTEGRFVSYASSYIRKALTAAIKSNGDEVSVDAPLGNKTNVSLLNIIPDNKIHSSDHSLFNSSISDQLYKGLFLLNDRERQVIELLYGIGNDMHTMYEVAVQMNLKRERVRQIRDKALRKMKKNK